MHVGVYLCFFRSQEISIPVKLKSTKHRKGALILTEA